MEDIDLTLLEGCHVREGKRKLDVLRKYGISAVNTDFCFLTGSITYAGTKLDEPDGFDMVGAYWLRTSDSYGDSYYVENNRVENSAFHGDRSFGIRPIINNPMLYDRLEEEKEKDVKGTFSVAFGEYPQFAVSKDIEEKLENGYQKNQIKTTKKNYVYDIGYDDFDPHTLEEYYFEDEKYVRMVPRYNRNQFYLSNGVAMAENQVFWIKVSPVIWLLDENKKLLVSKRCLVGGIAFNNTYYYGCFAKTNIKKYMDTYLTPNIFDSVNLKKDQILSENEALKSFVYRKNLFQTSKRR